LIGQDAYLFLGLDEKGGLYFDPDFHANHNEFLNFMLMPQGWTLSMELCFYLLAPLLVRRSVLMLGMIIVASLAVRIALAFWLGWIGDPWNHRFFPSELALFLCGSVSYRIYHVMRTGKMDAKSWYLWVALGAAAGCALLVNRLPGGIETWLNIGFVVAVLSALPFLFKLTKSWSIDRHIGELSYPVYLSHMMVIWLFVLMEVQEGLERSIGIILVTLILSFTLYWNIDRKVDIFRHNFRMTKAVNLHDSNIQQT
jgi:peptidoglycan/LPS O-acetylase OafA/YrhL